ncbi:MAG: hypothetical protein ACK5KK_11480, partial [Microbacterium sp.]
MKTQILEAFYANLWIDDDGHDVSAHGDVHEPILAVQTTAHEWTCRQQEAAGVVGAVRPEGQGCCADSLDSMGCAVRCASDSSYCVRCDLLVGLDGLHVVGVGRDEGLLVIDAESPPGPVGCPGCGVVAESAGRKSLT